MSDEIRFTVDASLIDRLGKELVAKQETALAELIKNAYDADATFVTVDFVEDENGNTDKIIIQDNGCGMSKSDLINKFFRISADNKIKNPYSERFNRKCAGRKGIGRFSLQRLGKKLTMITKNKNKTHMIFIDWNLFKNATLDAIPINIKQLKGDNSKKIKEGTIFNIEELNDSWTKTQQLRVYRYVSSILQPFPYSTLKVSTVTTKKGHIINDPGFNVGVYRKIPQDRITIADQEKNIFEHSVASIDIKIKQRSISTTIESQYHTYNKSKKTGKEFLDRIKILIGNKNNSLIYDEGKNAYKNYNLEAFKDIHAKVFFFIRKPEYIPRNMKSVINEILNNFGGVRVYRNGFRVLPYGEPDNDWLSLDEKISVLKGTRFGNKNVLGYVLINDPDANFFDETSSREGLFNIPEFTLLQYLIMYELRDSIRDILKNHLNNRGYKEENEQTEELKTDDPNEEIDELLTALNELKQKAKDEDKDEFDDAINTIEIIKTEFRKKIDEIEMLRVLAGLGLAIGQFVHEIRDRLLEFNSLSKFVLDSISDSEIKNNVEKLIDKVFSFQTYTSYFEGVIHHNLDRDKKVLPLNSIARKFWDIIKGDAVEQGINFPEPAGEGYFFYITPMHESEWSSILFNLYTNSKKAIMKANTKDKKINIFLYREENYIILDFLDSGVGIPEKDKNKIFQPFFTTTSFVDESDYQGIKGMGLGLKIVKDIISSYKGIIYVAEPKEGFSTCIRLKIPIATKEEIKDYEYS